MLIGIYYFEYFYNPVNIFKEKVKTIPEGKIKLLGFIPENTELMKYNLFGKNLLDLPNDNEAYNKAKEMFKTLL